MQAALDELAQKRGQEFDIMYINMIIAHHADAVEMAEMVDDDVPHRALRDALAALIDDQEAEIRSLTSVLKEFYGQEVTPDPRMMMSERMMAQLQAADAVMREKLVLAMMREHHQSAIDMGELVLQQATSQALKDQAQQMIDAQRAEQAQFGTWLQQWYGMTPPASTGDMQHGMDAVMDMSLPATGATDWRIWTTVAGAIALLSSGYVLRRKRA
jgi:LPXTG-motif cell wall-anchored protein